MLKLISTLSHIFHVVYWYICRCTFSCNSIVVYFLVHFVMGNTLGNIFFRFILNLTQSDFNLKTSVCFRNRQFFLLFKANENLWGKEQNIFLFQHGKRIIYLLISFHIKLSHETKQTPYDYTTCSGCFL